MIDLTASVSLLVTVLCAFAAVAAIAALGARSLFVAAVAAAAMVALAAAAMLGAGDADGALAFGAVGVGIAPVLLLGVTLLSAPAAKPGRKVWPLIAVVIAAGAGVAVLFALPELAVTENQPIQSAEAALWLAGLMFVAAVGVVGLLGFGERGVLEHPDQPS